MVKELVLRSNGAIRVGSNPTPRISANSSVVEFNSSKVETWVRFPLGASEFLGTLQKPSTLPMLSNGLGCGVFTPEIRVRFPASEHRSLESLPKQTHFQWPCSPVVRTRDFESRNRSSNLRRAIFCLRSSNGRASAL